MPQKTVPVEFTIRDSLDEFKPREIVKQLDQYIVGQAKAKKLVALALRNRIRRKNVAEDMRDEIAPKNILMIGPTGVGKTEVARRMAQILNAPFIKIEATKFTERGYVGRDVEHMIRSLVNHSVNLVRSQMREASKEHVGPRVLKTLQREVWNELVRNREVVEIDADPAERRRLKNEVNKKLAAGEYDGTEISVSIRKKPTQIFPIVDMFPGMEDMEVNFQNIFGGDSELSTEELRRMTVKEARTTLTQQYMDEYIDKDKAIEFGLKWAQEMGIVFIDEIDKIADKASGQGPDVSREGVQRDLLPIVEGTNVNTKYGIVKTDHMLFIAAGAFHISKPSDMIPELQGRFPIRVELESLNKDDLKRILVEPKNSLVKQYRALLATENVDLQFREEAYHRIAEIAFEINNTTENIGARRLHTIMEFLLEDISFDAPDMKDKTVTIDAEYVNKRLAEIVRNKETTRYIL